MAVLSLENLSVIVPCYWANEHLIDLTKTCLSELEGLDVIVVDDGSPLQPAIPSVRRETNGGYASAVNTGIQNATGDILIICNNDIDFIQPDWLDHLLAPLHDGSDISLIRQSDADGWITEDKWTENDKFGALWAITRDAYKKLGPLDERFGKGYFDDLDYWHRAQDLGLKITKNHNGLVDHKGKQTFKAVDPQDELFGINMFKYKEKWGDDAYIIETAPDAVMLLDKYEVLQKTPAEQYGIKKLSISLEEAKQRWSNA